jgi:hypothetical protein
VRQLETLACVVPEMPAGGAGALRGKTDLVITCLLVGQEHGRTIPLADVGRTGCFTLDRWRYFAEGLFACEKPDRYAAAICITVRPDCLLRGYSVGERCRLSVLRRERTSDAIRML